MGSGPLNVVLHVDGGARGNPGPAAAGVVITDAADGQEIYKAGYYLGEATNNVAEYRGLISGLAAAKQLGAATVLAYSDSELLVRQINGIYRVRQPHLKTLFEQAQAEIGSLDRFAIEHVRREKNKEADRLVNLALDSRRDVLSPD